MYAKSDDKDRSVMGSVIAEEMDLPSPRVFYDPVEEKVVSVGVGNNPVDLREVQKGRKKRNVDQDTLLDAYAAKILLGDTDAHSRNIAVLPGGAAYSFDYGHRVSEIGYAFNFVKGMAKNSINDLTENDNFTVSSEWIDQELRTRVDKLASDIEVSVIKDRLAERTEIPDENRYDSHLETRMSNLTKAVNRQWEPKDGLERPEFTPGDLFSKKSFSLDYDRVFSDLVDEEEYMPENMDLDIEILETDDYFSVDPLSRLGYSLGGYGYDKIGLTEYRKQPDSDYFDLEDEQFAYL